jgi:predicted nucleic acid-binding protein
MDAAGAVVIVPEIADYEVRRELLRVAATAGLRRLDRLVSALAYDPITTAAMRRAAEFWALVRNAGLPTADTKALDADCILAAQAVLLGGSGDSVEIATTNVRHIARFPGVQAGSWEDLAP